MSASQPQFMYLILVLPALFGVILIGEGIYKMTHDDSAGFINLMFGMVFLAACVVAYFFFSTYLKEL